MCVGVIGVLAIALGIRFVVCSSPPKARPAATPAAVSTAPLTRGKAVVGTRELTRVEPTGTLRLEGQVIDEHDQPVAGAEVYIQPGDKPVTSGADGSFAIERLLPREYRLRAYKGELYSTSVPVRLTPTSEPVILRMRTGATFVIHVADAAGPIVGATVIVDSRTPVLTDATGTARISGISSFFHDVRVSSAGHASGGFNLMLPEDPGGVIEKTVTLRSGAALAGIVVAPDGSRVRDAQIDIEDVDHQWHEQIESDATGAWEVPMVAAGTYVMRATSKTYGSDADVTVELDGTRPHRDVVLKVAVAAQIVGTVVDATGAPVAGATVIAGREAADTFQAATDASGRFELLGVPGGGYDVLAHTGRDASPVMRVNVALNERVDVRLITQPAGIGGVVVDSSGAPIAEAHVQAMPTGGLSPAAFSNDTTDAQGRFDLGGLAQGEYMVSATHADQDNERLGDGERVTTGRRDVKIVLPTPATLTGRVLFEGAPMPYYGVLLTESPQFPFIGDPRGVRAADGRFTLRNVQPGTWGLVIMGPRSGRKTLENIEIAAAKVTDLGDIVVPRGLRISGTVRDTSGAAVDGASVSLGRKSDEPTQLQQWFHGTYETTTNAQGAFLFDGVVSSVAPKGRPSQIMAMHPRVGTSVPRPVVDRDANMDLVLVATGGIDGVVEGLTDRASSVFAHATATRADAGAAPIDATGSFRFDGLPPGEYTLSMIPLPGKSVPPPVTVTVVANQRARTKLVMPRDTVQVILKILGGTCTAIVLRTPGDAHSTNFAQCAAGAATYEGVAPGSYEACPGGEGCTSITVAAAPATQTFEIRAP
jgi:protocatechuate 3,4-dioxygenase beta subunit